MVVSLAFLPLIGIGNTTQWRGGSPQRHAQSATGSPTSNHSSRPTIIFHTRFCSQNTVLVLKCHSSPSSCLVERGTFQQRWQVLRNQCSRCSLGNGPGGNEELRLAPSAILVLAAYRLDALRFLSVESAAIRGTFAVQGPSAYATDGFRPTWRYLGRLR